MRSVSVSVHLTNQNLSVESACLYWKVLLFLWVVWSTFRVLGGYNFTTCNVAWEHVVVRVLLFLDATLDVVLLASVGSLLIACFLKIHTQWVSSHWRWDYYVCFVLYFCVSGVMLMFVSWQQSTWPIFSSPSSKPGANWAETHTSTYTQSSGKPELLDAIKENKRHRKAFSWSLSSDVALNNFCLRWCHISTCAVESVFLFASLVLLWVISLSSHYTQFQ